MTSNRIILKIAIALTAFSMHTFDAKSQIESLRDLKFHEIVTKKSDDWFKSDDAKSLADSLIKYQTASGGWPKNQQWHLGANQEQMHIIETTDIGATIDNDATTQEMEYLRRIYNETGKNEYRLAFLRGLYYLLAAQYENGGWPQFYPIREGYSSHITFNDNAMVNVMKLLKTISENDEKYKKLKIDKDMRKKCKTAFNKGIDCILKCQIKKGNRLTVWCQQHDEYTLLPANARSYELASMTGCGETEGIIRLLMSIDNPTPEITKSIKSAVKWLEKHTIKNMELQTFTNKEGKKDKRLVKKKNATLLWARFYDLNYEKPYFCDRSGYPKRNIEDIDYERRNGYCWVSSSPERLIKEYHEIYCKKSKKKSKQ